MAKDLLYKPSLTYDKNYYTEGDLYDSEQNSHNDDESFSSNLPEKIESINNIKDDLLSKLPLLPDSIQGVVKPSIDIIGNVVDDLVNKKDEFNDKDDDEIKVIPIYPSDNDDDKDLNDIPDDPFGSEPSATITIPDKETDVAEKIEKQYVEDLLDVLEDYLNKQNLATQNYINSIFTYITYAKTDDLIQYTSKNISNNNLRHVTDYVTKSKIGLKQHIRLYKKLFTLDETIYHLRAVKVAKEQLKRYKSIERIEDKNLLTKNSNDLLMESRIIAEKKYKENFYGLYKYLNSSVILFNECMNTYVKQKRSLILLNNEERE